MRRPWRLTTSLRELRRLYEKVPRKEALELSAHQQRKLKRTGHHWYVQLDENGSGKIDFSEFRALLNGDGVASDSLSSKVEDKEELMNKLKALMEKAVEKGVSVDACFAHFDKDGDGNIKKEEFMMAMTELGFDADKSVVNGVIKLLDRNQSGAISLSEFKQLFPVSSEPSSKAPSPPDGKEKAETIPDEKKTPRDKSKRTSARQTTEEKLRKLLLSAEASGVDVKKCFAHFDSDNSGMITKVEFITAIKQLPGFEDVADDETAAIVNKLDKDGSGSVSLEEFEAFLRQPTLTSHPIDADTNKKEQDVQEDDSTKFTDGGDESTPPSQENDVPDDTAVDATKAADATNTEDVKGLATAETFQIAEGGDGLTPVEPPNSDVGIKPDVTHANVVDVSKEDVNDAFHETEGGDESVPVEPPVVVEAEAAKPKVVNSSKEETTDPPADTSQPDRSPRSLKKPSEQGEPTEVSGGGGCDKPPNSAETTQAVPAENAQVKTRPSERPVRSSSFGKGRPLPLLDL